MELLSKNALLGAFIAGIAVIIVSSAAQWLYRRVVRAPKVHAALKAGLAKHQCTFLPSAFLVSETNYTITEIEKLCTMHPNIVRNKKQFESWCIK